MASSEYVQTFLTIEDVMDDENKGANNDNNSNSGDTAISGYDEARDEIKEIQNIRRTETRLIRTWRIILLVLFVITAAAVSSITYLLLQQEEYAAFQASVRTAGKKGGKGREVYLPSKTNNNIHTVVFVPWFEKFAASIGDAAIIHDKNIKLAIAALAEAITAHSESVNSNWPFFQMPFFASYAHHAMKLSGAEMVWLFNTVLTTFVKSIFVG
jgi:hypothetical protein